MNYQLRKQILKSSYEAGACHIGSALSCVEIIDAIYDVKKEEDIFLFSKASGVCALYCKLFPDKATELIKKYPLPHKEAGLIWSGGSLGMGLSVACGLAITDRNRKVYCLISDGELQEGQTWEAIMFANHHNLNNLMVVVDRNGIQALDFTENIIKLEPLQRKFEFFGWDCDSVDGHNVSELKRSIQNISPNKPLCVIAQTIKGKGVDFMEDDASWHYKNLYEEGFKKAILSLDEREIEESKSNPTDW